MLATAGNLLILFGSAFFVIECALGLPDEIEFLITFGDERIIAQLWHTGAIAHPDMRGSSQPLSASDVDLLYESVTASGRKPTVAPRPMTTAEI